MAKFTFEVEVTGAVEGWELALALKDRFNGPYANAPIHVESVTLVDFGSSHCATCDCDDE